MLAVVVPTRRAETGPFHPPPRDAHPAAAVSGVVNYDKVAVFAHIDGQDIHCLSGHLWVTIENDIKDYVLDRGQRLLVPSAGRVVIGGKGRYLIRAGNTDLP